MAGMAFVYVHVHASHRVDLIAAGWLTALLVVAVLAWGGMAATAVAALIARR
jgi:hypothetical protein